MASITLSDAKNELLNDIAKKQGFKEYKIEVKSGSMKGDGYLGIINTVDIQDVEKPEKKLNLIMKSAMESDELRGNTPIRKAYGREIYMYETVFPEYRKFSEDFGIENKFVDVPKTYGSLFAEKQECIVLENLREINFKLWNRRLPMNHEHVALVFATYGKFHATGLSLKTLRPEKYQEIAMNIKDIFEEEDQNEAEEQMKKFEASFDGIFENGFKAIAGDEELTQAFKRFTQGCSKFFREVFPTVDKYSTILHGDCWCNNMMFRYDDLEHPLKPTEVCLLDWQISRIGSPILDLSYFFYASASREVLQDFKKFLKIYYDTVKKTLEDAGLKDDEILTYEELETQWKIYSKYGLFMVTFVMKVVLGEPDEVPDVSEDAKSGKNLFESITDWKLSNMDDIYKRIADVIISMNDFGYL